MTTAGAGPIVPTAWLPAPTACALGPDDVHVWRVPLAQPLPVVEALARLLAEDERDRAARFHFERHRVAFTVARGALRTLAARYLGHAPERLVFGYRDRGKPHLVAPVGDDLRFNVSHSGDVGLVCFARSREVGIDVEQKRTLQDLLALARTSFSAHELAALCRLAPAEHHDAFFACWSRKEAFIKATGEGIAQLAAFDVSLAPGEPARLLRVPDEPRGPRWSLHDLPPIPGCAAALVIDGLAPAIACWDCPDTIYTPYTE
ncbi:MAG TPA: 4'-phosphopantetheinyl transferase superfamily protein [Kofleriaceae bacterium]